MPYKFGCCDASSSNRWLAEAAVHACCYLKTTSAPAGPRQLRQPRRVLAASAQPSADASSSSASSSSSSKATAPSSTSSSAPGVIKIPRSIHEVDNGKILGFGADLSEDHPVCGTANCRAYPHPLPLCQFTSRWSYGGRSCSCLQMCQPSLQQ
jgi:hypothetical protein